MKVTRIDILAFVATVAMVAVTGVIFIGGANKQIQRLTEEQKELSERLNYIQVLTDTIGRGEEVLSKLREEIRRLDERFPADMAVEDFYMDVAGFAEANSVELTQMRPGKMARREGYVEMPITVSASAPFENIHRFLFLVGNVPRLTKWDRLVIQAAGEPGCCRVEMVVKIYSVEGLGSGHGS